MTDNSTPQTPPMEKEEFDLAFLDDMMNYSADRFSVLSMVDFKNYWAPRFFSEDVSVQDAAKSEWEYNVAYGRNKPVYLLNESGERTWVFPPLLGDLRPGVTGSPDSMSAQMRAVQAMSDRLTAQGNAARERLFREKAPEVYGKVYWQRRLHEIRAYCGYPYPGEASIEASEQPVAPSTLSNSDEYDY